jgi:hypothetical protein
VAALRTVLINIHLVQLQCYDGNAWCFLLIKFWLVWSYVK